MTLTIEELERRLWIDGRERERAELLAYEAACADVEDSFGRVVIDDIFMAKVKNFRVDL